MEWLLGHGTLRGNRRATRINGFWFTCQPSPDETARVHRAHVAPRRPRDPHRSFLPSPPFRPSPPGLFLAPANERPHRPRASDGPVQRRGEGSAGRAGDYASLEAWQPLASLTQRQRDLRELAYHLGYYASPAKATLRQIAGLVGITRAAVSKHLRAAERKIFAAALGGNR